MQQTAWRRATSRQFSSARRNPPQIAVFPEFCANRVTFRVAQTVSGLPSSCGTQSWRAGLFVRRHKNQIFYSAPGRNRSHDRAPDRMELRQPARPFLGESHALDLITRCPILRFVLTNQSHSRPARFRHWLGQTMDSSGAFSCTGGSRRERRTPRYKPPH